MKYTKVGLPKTTPLRYLTGKTALNIPAPEGTTGDWHFFESFFGRGSIRPKFFVAGEGYFPDTQTIFGDYGIYDCSDLLREKGIYIEDNEKVYSANHKRAVLDLLYSSLEKDEYPYHIDIDDWIDIDSEKQELIEHIKKLNQFLQKEASAKLQLWLSKQV